MPERAPSARLGGLGWRLGAARRWLVGRASAGAVQAVARIRLLRRIPRWAVVPVERALVAARGAGLFDPVFYGIQNPDVAAAGGDPFEHYLRYGWAEGRAPNARFDDGYYRAESGLGASVPVSALAHFIAFGQRGGLCPVPGMDLDGLGRCNPGLAVARIDPYRRLVAGAARERPGRRPEMVDALRRLRGLAPPVPAVPEVDVVIPVYLGRAETLNTIASVLAARNATPVRVVAVNDASPDPALEADLWDLAERGLIAVIEKPANAGFVGAVNTGTALGAGRDVIWLNADTEVYDGWVDRLRAAALSRPNVATVTPLTNNGTICSYPRTNADNPGELELAWPELDRLAARVNTGVRVEAPTAVGFAVYVRRAALDALGALDEAAFGRGYGEENDLSQRALARGWVNLIAADVFVRHFGATSFGSERAGRVEAALRVLDRRYPAYRAAVQAHLAADPLGAARRALDRARLERLAGARNVLLVRHSLGGGTEQHVQEEIARLAAAGASVFLLSGGTAGPGTAALSHLDAGPMPGLSALALDSDELWQVLGRLDLDEVHVHHLIDFGPEAPGVLARRLRALGVPFDFVVHDYYAVCPRINLVDAAGTYCGEPGEAGCRTCLIRRGARAGRPDIARWRAAYGGLLGSAREVRVPDADVARRLRRYFPDLENLRVVPHEPAPVPGPPAPRRRPGPLRIAVIGAIGPIKGFDAVLGLARHGGPEVALTVIGYTHSDAAARAAGVTVTGAYVNSEVDALIGRADPDMIWIPSLWPETYCYTLSIALRSGRPVAAFDLGAQAGRLRAAGRGTVLPLALARDPARLLRALRAAARETDPALVPTLG